MKNINIVQAVIFGISAIAIVAAVVMFAAYRGGTAGQKSSPVVLWGTAPMAEFDNVLQQLKIEDDAYENITYVAKDPATYEADLLKALAEGTGPDLVLLSDSQVISNQRRMQTIPFESFPLRTYQDIFLNEGDLLVTRDGIIGFPFLVDPLVMYYNKNILSNNGYARPPETWTEMLAITPTVTQKDSSFNISKSAIALGAFDNVSGAKQVFWTLVLQAGNPVMERYVDTQSQKELYRPILNENLNFTLNPAYAATNFYTQFANPTKTVYTWNRSLQQSRDMFVAGDLAFYLGFASEMPLLRRVNPNLNFDVALVPQSQSSERKATYGKMQIFMIPKATRNVTGAINAVAQLTSRNAQAAFSTALGVAPVRDDLLGTSDAKNSYQSIFNRSAIMSQGILEPNDAQTSAIIKELVDTVVSGQYEISDAIGRAQEKLITITDNE